MFVYILATVVSLWLVQHYRASRKWFQLPHPGFYVPGLGHFLRFLNRAMTNDPIQALWDLWKKNQKGGLLWVRQFSFDIAFCGDYETLKYLYNHPEMDHRFNKSMHHNMKEERMVDQDKEMHGVLLSDGKIWAEQRRFTLRTLRDFGFGKSSMEEMINEEVGLFKEEISKSEGEPFDFSYKFNLPILNALWRVTVGQRFEYDNPTLISIIRKLTDLFKRAGEPSNILLVLFPWTTKIYPKFLDRDVALEVNHDIMGLMKKSIKEHEETLDPNEPRDFTDKVLIEIARTTDPTSSYYGESGKDHLANTLMDMFIAGSETTSTTLTWAMLYMARYPAVLKQVVEELDRVVGRGRAPSLRDRPDLPYTEAVLMEIQRYANIAPTGVSHVSPNHDITVNGLTIPANTHVMPLFVELLKGDYWGDGTTFRPERFLDAEGRCKKDEHLIPFSIGRRQCLGETLAKTELFLFFTAIVQQFSILPEVEGQPPSEEYTNGITILPKPYKVRLTTRV